MTEQEKGVQHMYPLEEKNSIQHNNDSIQGLQEPDITYAYYNSDGTLAGEICRWNEDNGKKIIRPRIHYTDQNGNNRYKYEKFAEPYPLYNLVEIMANSEKPILIVEGEKCAEIAKSVFPQMIITTTPFGSNSADKCDFSPVKGRDVFIMRDFDSAGYEYMYQVCNLCAEAEAVSISEVPIEEFAKWSISNGSVIEERRIFEKGYDIADAIKEGFDQNFINKIFSPHITEKIPIDTWDMPDPSILHRENISINYKNILSDDLFKNLTEISNAYECSFEQVLVNLLGYSSNLIGNRRTIREEGEYTQPIHLWVMQIGESGQGKSNSMRPFKDAIAPIIENRQNEYKEQMRDYNAELMKYDQQKRNNKSTYIEAPEKPILRRFITQSATSEAIIRMMDPNHPECLLYAKDEISGIILDIERFQKGNYTMLLEAFDGARNFHYDRVGNGDKDPICIKMLSVGIVGGIQPDVFTKLLSEKNRANDGLLPRFLFVIAKHLDSYPERNRHQYDTEKLKEIFAKLDSLSLENKIIPFNEEAIVVYNVWRKDHRNIDQKYATGMMASCYARMDGHILRIAGTLEYLKWAASYDPDEPREISKESVLGACELIEELFKPTARSLIFGCSAGSCIENIINFLKYVKETGLTEFRKSEMDRYKYPFQLTHDEVKFLIDENFIKQKTCKKCKGRPPIDYLINPHIKNITEI